MSPNQVFSLDEATRVLPEVERVIVRLREVRTTALHAKERLNLLWQRLDAGDPVLEEISALQKRFDVGTREVNALVERLELIGCVLRDPDMGLVDFPALASGTPIFLCWRMGEDGIQYWHGRDEGYAGRKPLWTMPGTGPNYA